MASYQNTSEYYCGAIMDTYPGNFSDPIVYDNRHPGVYQTYEVAYYPENIQNQAIYPRPSLEPTQRQIICPIDYKNDPQFLQGPIFENATLAPGPVSYEMCNQEPRPYHNNKCMAKRHRAQISILPSSHGSFKATVKCKRKRTMFTTEQVQALEDIFKTKQYISREERQVIVKNLQLQDKAVKLWFQNRRLKAKRLQNEDSEEQEDCSSEKSARLDAVETEIRQKTDGNGFVILDDGLMRDLSNILQECLKTNSVHVAEEAPIYEPISPASGGEEDSFVSWRPPSDIDPSASFQRLLDLKTMLLL